MRKIGILVIVIFLFLGVENVFADDIPTDKERSVIFLQQFGIVDDAEKWDEKSNIKRRDLFDMVCRSILRPEIYEDFEDTDNASMDYWFDSLIKRGDIEKEFSDVEKYSDDYKKILLWVDMRILKGKVDENGNIFADLDGFLTNYEAIVIVCRMFEYYDFPWSGKQYYDYENNVYDYFRIAEDIGIINKRTNIDRNCTSIQREELNEYIKAYDCINMFYYALLTPTYIMSDFFGSYNYRFIEKFYSK